MIRKALYETNVHTFKEVQDQLEEFIATFFDESVYVMVTDTPHVVGDPIEKATQLLGCKPAVIGI